MPGDSVMALMPGQNVIGPLPEAVPGLGDGLVFPLRECPQTATVYPIIWGSSELPPNLAWQMDSAETPS